MDIRSFFGKASAGGGGGGSAAKAKTPPPGKSGAGKSGGKTAAAAAADKSAPTNKRQGNASPSRNKGISKMSVDKSPRGKARGKIVSRSKNGSDDDDDEDDDDDDDDDCAEVVPRPAKKLASGGKKQGKGSKSKAGSGSNGGGGGGGGGVDIDSDSDGAPVAGRSPARSTSAAVRSSPSLRKKQRESKVEEVGSPSRPSRASSRGGGQSSPSPVSRKGAASAKAKGKGSPGKASSPPPPTRTGARRRATTAVDYKDAEEDSDGSDGGGGGGGDDDDDDNFSEHEDSEGDSDAAEDDEEEEEEEEESNAARKSHKRKPTSSSSAPASSGSKKTLSSSSSSSKRGGQTSAVSEATPKKSNSKRAVVIESDDDSDAAVTTTTTTKTGRRAKEEEEEEEEEPTSSKHFSSSTPSQGRAASKRKSAGPGAENKKKEIVELGGTSSDDDDKEEEKEHTPRPRKKPAPTPAAMAAAAVAGARAKLSPASSAGGDSAKKKTPGSATGGGGFRPPWMGGGRKSPPNEGNKEVPVGAGGCLSGKTFVVSGVLDSLGREAAEDLVKQYGGKVTGSVSSRTTYLMLGSVLDDGRPPEEGSKHKKAKTLKTKIIDEDDLFDMLRKSNPQGGSSGSGSGSGSGSVPNAPAAAGTSKASGVVNPYMAKAAVANPYGAVAAKKPPGAVANPYGAAAVAGGGKAKASGKSPARTSPAAAAAVPSKPGQMWVDKYKPRSSSEVIGHQGQVKKLKTWLQNWERWHLSSSGGKPPMGKDNPGARAALLSGVPGVGKSSTATLVAKEMGYHVMELNASDTRNKASLSVELEAVIGNKVLSFKPGSSKNGGKSGGFLKQLVVMDEVDGMGGSDRGGIQELIKLIKKTKVPIIAICNDRQHQKIRSLVNHCYDLRFARPMKVTIAKRVKAVAKMEGMDVDDNAAEMLVEANGNDIRQVLHALQMWSRKSSKMTYLNLKGGLGAIEKDKIQRIGPFDAARTILGGASRTPLRDRYEAFFTDYSLLPLLVHQNYLSSLMNVDAATRVEVTASASAAVSDADMISGKMRGDVQHWELLPAQAALNVRVGSVGGGNLGFPEFPKWLGNYSKENKRRRMLAELSTHLNASISGGTEAVRLSYVHFLKAVLTKPLRDDGAEGAPECVALLEEYGLSRDDLFEIMPEFQLSTKGMKKPPPDVFASLESKTKSAVTRCYNALSHKSQALAEALQAPKKAKKRKAPPKSLSMMGEDEEDEEEAEDEEDEEEDLSAFRKKSKPAARSKGKAAAKPRAKKAKK